MNLRIALVCFRLGAMTEAVSASLRLWLYDPARARAGLALADTCSACDVKKTNPPPFCPVERGDSMWCPLSKNLAALAREKCRRFGRKTHIVVLASSEDQQFAALLVDEFGLF